VPKRNSTDSTTPDSFRASLFVTPVLLQPFEKGACAVADPSDLQRNYKEFLDLLPLTLALAGLPRSDSGKYYTEDQIESRVFTLRHAYKAARSVARDCIQK
jgi:hypothetical protein